MLTTAFAKTIDCKMPLSEYPTPQFQRDSYLCLNGFWDFKKDRRKGNPNSYSQRIVVPFAVETSLSGVAEKVTKEDVLHYHRTFSLPKGFKKENALLHFEAVDQICSVYLNGILVGHHEGGYLSFSCDCGRFLQEENDLYVEVRDDTSSELFPRGKQREKPGGIWYTPTSGIYQSVWLEALPATYISSLRLVPDIHQNRLAVSLTLNQGISNVEAIAYLEGKEVGHMSFSSSECGVLSLTSPIHLWSPDSPVLYDLILKVGEDEVRSYFAMREFSKTQWQGHWVFALNDRPLFLSGLLDQGYTPESGLTPPCEEAMIYDLKKTKEYGFNMLRKHIKMEPMRWYYHCDRLGIIVIQDFVNGGATYKPWVIGLAPFLSFHWDDKKPKIQKRLGRNNPESRRMFERDIVPTIDRLFNCPCIAIWTLFNEGWGQFDSARFVAVLRKADPTRLIDATSGWFDQGGGDFSSRHIYFRKIRLKNDGKRILSLSEFGGYTLHDMENSWNKKVFGYKLFHREDRLNAAYEKLYRTQVIPSMKKEGLSISALTQLTDVEAETNGLITYNRKIDKARVSLFQQLNKELKFDD